MMNIPAFSGLYNASQGLRVAQEAMSVIGNNITNANTPGYSEEEVTLTEGDPYTNPSLTQQPGGQLGQGPVVQQITRANDDFLNAQYRTANGTLNTDSNISNVLQQIEGVLNEPSTSGISAGLQSFFTAAQALSTNPSSSASRTNFLQQGVDLVNTFQQDATQLAAMRQNLVGDPSVPNSFNTSQLAVTADQINTDLSNIASLNQQIVTVKASGAQPNDLMDQRDQILDKLSGLVDIQVTTHDNDQIDLSIGGQTMIQAGKQVNSLQVVQNLGALPLPSDVPSLVETTNGGIILNSGIGPGITGGQLTGISNMGGNNPALTTVQGTLTHLDSLLNTIVNQVNTLQTSGFDQNGNANPPAMFVSDPTLNPTQSLNIFHWTVNPTLITDPSQLAAAINDPTAPSGFSGSGDGRNAANMAQLQEQTFAALGGAGFSDYLNGIVSKLGVDANSYQNNTTSDQAAVQSLDQQRQTATGVNTDQETVNLLMYQRAFEASAKVVSTMDQINQDLLNMVQ